jgi:2-C-methyl-D-erythritol 4-phosphate cytidylyltransferase
MGLRRLPVTPAPDVEALIQGAGQGTRLGLGPKAFVLLGGKTLLERAVATVSAVAARVIVAVAPEDVARASALVGGSQVNVIAGGDRRTATLRKLVTKSTAPWLMLHEVTHPLADVELAAEVLAAARRAGCAVAAMPNDVSIYAKSGARRALPGEAVMLQKPIAFRRETINAGFEIVGDAESSDLGVLEILMRAGAAAEFVPGCSTNFKITTAADLALARAVVAQERQDTSQQP